MKSPINILAVIGLTFGGVFGMAGSFTANPHLQASLWAIDSAGLVMATALLALKYFRTGHDLVAGGFLVFAIAIALLLVSIPRQFALPVRLLGLVSAILF